MEFPEDFYQYLKNNTLVEIKGGLERESFLQIWMVTVGNRVFARSWNKSPKSWFTAFLHSGKGQIKYNNTIIEVEGKKLSEEDEIHEEINRAYLEKYKQKANVKYAKGITHAEYKHYTLELFYRNKK